MNKNISSNRLNNGVKIYIVPDNYIDYDIVIKFNNYGSNLDKYINIYGIQHLLEHCIFFNYKNLNIMSNASTCPTYMSLEFNIPDKNFQIHNLLKHWLFLDDDYTKINFSRKLTIENVKRYINELHSEYEYRKLLNIPWELQTLILSDNKAHYFGGNKYTFENKEKYIQKYLLNPIPVPPEDIIIFLKKSKDNFYIQLETIFNKIKIIKPKKVYYDINIKTFYNKIIQINSTKTNSLIFPITIKNFSNETILHYVRILYPFMNFEQDISIYYIYFTFNNINNLYYFYYILQSQNYNLLSLENYNTNICPILDILNIDKYPEEILNLNVETFSNLFKKQKHNILFFFKYLSNLIHEKKFLINLTKNFLYNNETLETQEKYYITDANFLDEYFYNYYFFNFDIITYIDNILHMYKIQKVSYKLFCKSICNKINLTNKTNYLYSNSLISLHYQTDNNLKLTFSTYISALISYFINFNASTLDEYLRDYLNKKSFSIKNTKNHEIILSNRIFKIKTEYDFLFFIYKLNYKEIKYIDYVIANLEEFLKQKGLCYYIESCLVKFKKFGLLFIYSNISQNNFNETLNNIISFFKSNYYSLNINIVLSYKAKERNFTSLNKSIKCIF